MQGRSPGVAVLDVDGDRAMRRLDDVLRRDADVRTLGHLAGERVLVGAPQPDLLGPDADRDRPLAARGSRGTHDGAVLEPDGAVAEGLALEEVGDTEEPCDEGRRGPLVEV